MVHIFLILLDRFEVARRVTIENLKRVGMPYTLYVVDNASADTRCKVFAEQTSDWYALNQRNEGVARTQNAMMFFARQQARPGDLFCLLGNDIEMPDDWAPNMEPVDRKHALIGCDCLGHADKIKPSDEWPWLKKSHNAFGSVVFRPDILDSVGWLCNDFHPYGLEDSDWHHRIAMAGMSNFYLANKRSVHVGNDVGSGTDYRNTKDNSLAQGQVTWNNQQQWYGRNAERPWYLPPQNGQGFTVPTFMRGMSQRPPGGV